MTTRTKRRFFAFSIRSLLVFIFLLAGLLALTRDIPYCSRHHGAFTVAQQGEISVYEFYDDPRTGTAATPGKWDVNVTWVNRGRNHWTPIELLVNLESISLAEITWETEPRLCSVQGSMTSIFDPSRVRKFGLEPILVPWQDEPLAPDAGSIGIQDEFWEMRFPLIMTEYGVILVAGNGDDGAFQYIFGHDSSGRVCAVKCVLESDPESYLQDYKSKPRLARMWWNAIYRLGFD